MKLAVCNLIVRTGLKLNLGLGLSDGWRRISPGNGANNLRCYHVGGAG